MIVRFGFLIIISKFLLGSASPVKVIVFPGSYCICWGEIFISELDFITRPCSNFTSKFWNNIDLLPNSTPVPITSSKFHTPLESAFAILYFSITPTSFLNIKITPVFAGALPETENTSSALTSLLKLVTPNFCPVSKNLFNDSSILISAVVIFLNSSIITKLLTPIPKFSGIVIVVLKLPWLSAEIVPDKTSLIYNCNNWFESNPVPTSLTCESSRIFSGKNFSVVPVDSLNSWTWSVSVSFSKIIGDSVISWTFTFFSSIVLPFSSRASQFTPEVFFSVIKPNFTDSSGLSAFDALNAIICPLAFSFPVHPGSALNDLNVLSDETHTLIVLIFDVLFLSLRISSIMVLDSPLALTDIVSAAAASESEKMVNKDKTRKAEARIPNFEIIYIWFIDSFCTIKLN